MDRLTYDHKEQIKDSQKNIIQTINHGPWLKNMSWYNVCENACVLFDEDGEGEPDCKECPLKKAIDKLSKYEDIGLTPTELAKAKAEERLVELPIKIDDFFYGIKRPIGKPPEIYESKVQGFRITRKGLKVINSQCYELYADEINKFNGLFLTREEAEAALNKEVKTS